MDNACVGEASLDRPEPAYIKLLVFQKYRERQVQRLGSFTLDRALLHKAGTLHPLLSASAVLRILRVQYTNPNKTRTIILFRNSSSATVASCFHLLHNASANPLVSTQPHHNKEPSLDSTNIRTSGTRFNIPAYLN